MQQMSRNVQKSRSLGKTILTENFSETIFTPKEWFLSKKGQKEGERVARGHFHERVGETPVHWLPPGVGFTQKPFSVSENGPIENFLRSNSIFI